MKNENLSNDEHCEIYKNSDKEITHILFNSDKTKDRAIFEIDMNTVIQNFQDIENSHITSISITYNEKKR